MQQTHDMMSPRTSILLKIHEHWPLHTGQSDSTVKKIGKCYQYTQIDRYPFYSDNHKTEIGNDLVTLY